MFIYFLGWAFLELFHLSTLTNSAAVAVFLLANFPSSLLREQPHQMSLQTSIHLSTFDPPSSVCLQLTAYPHGVCQLEKLKRFFYHSEQKLFALPDHVSAHMIWEQKGGSFIRQSDLCELWTLVLELLGLQSQQKVCKTNLQLHKKKEQAVRERKHSQEISFNIFWFVHLSLEEISM